MAERVSMNRLIHDAVRRDLNRLTAVLSTFPAGDTERARGLERAYRNLQGELTRHHEGEDRWIWPALAKLGVDADLLAAMESEHEAMATALDQTSTAMSRLAGSASAEDAAAAQQSVVSTRTVVERHLSHEEEELEPAMLPHLRAPEWKAVEKKLRSEPLSVAGPFFAWLTDGMTEQDRTSLRASVPAPVTFVLSRGFGRRYYREVAPVWRS